MKTARKILEIVTFAGLFVLIGTMGYTVINWAFHQSFLGGLGVIGAFLFLIGAGTLAVLEGV